METREKYERLCEELDTEYPDAIVYSKIQLKKCYTVYFELLEDSPYLILVRDHIVTVSY